MVRTLSSDSNAPLLYPTVIFVGARLGLFVSAVVFSLTAPQFGDNVIGYFCKYDCAHYSRLVTEGYNGDIIRTNFFPGFFLLVRLFVRLFSPEENAPTMVVVANVASWLSFIVIYRLFCRLADARSAQMALAVFAFFPFAFFQASGYPESFAILLTALALTLSQRGQSVAAGIVLSAAVLTRHVTIFAGLGLLGFEWQRANGDWRQLLRRPQTYALLFPLAAVVGFMIYCQMQFSDPLAFIHARSAWGSNAWRGADGVLTADPTGAHLHVLFRSYLLLGLIPSIGAVALLRRPDWRPLGFYALSFMLTIWVVGIFGFGRYAASCWPAFLPVGAWLKDRPGMAVALLGSLAMLQLAFFFLHTHLVPIL